MNNMELLLRFDFVFLEIAITLECFQMCHFHEVSMPGKMQEHFGDEICFVDIVHCWTKVFIQPTKILYLYIYLELGRSCSTSMERTWNNASILFETISLQ